MYAEMSSMNPVFLLPRPIASRAETLAQAFVDSLTLGVGQFCANPGLVIAIEGEDLERFQSAAQKMLAAKTAGTMLTAGIQSAYTSGFPAQFTLLDVARSRRQYGFRFVQKPKSPDKK